jgi:hypothetical protein
MIRVCVLFTGAPRCQSPNIVGDVIVLQTKANYGSDVCTIVAGRVAMACVISPDYDSSYSGQDCVWDDFHCNLRKELADTLHYTIPVASL